MSILASNSELQNAWIGQKLTDVKAFFWGKTENVRNYFSLRTENEILTAENTTLLNEILAYRQDSTDNQANRFHITREHYVMIPANIVTMSRGSQHNYIIVDRGSEDGVEVDDAIIGPRCAAGIIQSVSKHFALAISFENKDMVVSARELRTSIVGSLSWEGTRSNRAKFCDVPVHCDIEPGDTIVTSGFSSMIPADIPLGVVMAKSVHNGSTSEFEIELFDDLHKIRTLAVVKNLDRDEINDLADEGK